MTNRRHFVLDTSQEGERPRLSPSSIPTLYSQSRDSVVVLTAAWSMRRAPQRNADPGLVRVEAKNQGGIDQGAVDRRRFGCGCGCGCVGVGVWVCGCVDVWMCGCVDVWVRGCVKRCVKICVDACGCGCGCGCLCCE
jgi:hypothetical protein